MRLRGLLVEVDLGDMVAGYIRFGVRRRIPAFLSCIMMHRCEQLSKCNRGTSSRAIAFFISSLLYTA